MSTEPIVQLSAEPVAAPTAKPTARDQRALNAYRHGLTGQVLVLPPAELVAYRKHCQSFHDSLAPQGALEIDLVQSIADDRWRLKRAAAMDMNIFAIGTTEPDKFIARHEEIDNALAMAYSWLEKGKSLQLLTLYEGRIQRRVDKNTALLLQMQRERREALKEYARQAAALGESYQFPREALPAQFDISSVEVATLATHYRSLSAVNFQPRPPRKPLREAA